MPYEYRNMTPEERAAVLEYRRQQRYPLHAPPHPYRETGEYFLTATNFEHRPLIHPSNRRNEFEARLIGALGSIKAEIGGWVVLPNHYHILVSVDSLDDVSVALKQLHGATSRE